MSYVAVSLRQRKIAGMETNEESLLGLCHAGDREAHIIGEDLGGGRAMALCGKDLRVWPLAEGERVRVHPTCQRFFDAARMAAKEVRDDE